jgi:hypothetical protein
MVNILSLFEKKKASMISSFLVGGEKRYVVYPNTQK